MIIKKKSLLVAMLSSIVVAVVLILTLLGYIVYVELKGREFRHSYMEAIKAQ